ncbi:MAG: transcriptional regulator NrdR [Clostridiales bacterium]|nr:transcriptional regulator NrdR [Clostridiales bacterium]
MKCPFCGYPESKVCDSRPVEENEKIRRRRECLNCAKRFTTYEAIESLPIMVVKRDNSREPFDKQKLIRGLIRACEKRPVSYEEIEKLATDIEVSISNSLEREVSSKQIGEYAMEGLRDIDEVAYVRFASVYRQFKDISTFMEEINKLTSEKTQNS